MGTKNTPQLRIFHKNKKQKPHQHQPEAHSRARKWITGSFIALAALILVLFIWFRLSPWPGAMVIRWVFEQGGRKTTAALQAHEPKSGIKVISDQQYKPGDSNAKLDVYVPTTVQAGKKLPVVIWTHGGAWLSGDKADSAAYFKLLAQAGYVVVAPNYTLAPQAAYPTPIHQLNAAHAFVQNNAGRFQADTGKIFLAGDSAGSQLSAQLAALATNPAYAHELGIVPAIKAEQLKGAILTCGIYKMEELAHPHHTVSKLIGWGDDVAVWAYSGTHDFSDPVIRQMSPYYHVTKDFPATFITGGNDDPLTDVQSKPFAAELERLGVSVTRLFYAEDHQPKLAHEYQFDLSNNDGKKALEQIVAFLDSRR